MILYEDQDIIVCHKPAGIPVQSANTRQKDMVSLLNNHLAETGARWKKGEGRTEKGYNKVNSRVCETIYVVHRLDQPVEGVVVFAKNKKSAAELNRQVTQGTMKKIYQAVCCMERQETNGHLTDYLVKDGKTNTSRVCRKEERDAKFAELYYQVKQRKIIQGKNYLLVEIDLRTGRHHQIRVQMAHAGLPLYGDRKYNPLWQDYRLSQKELLCSAAEKEGQFPALCAVSLTFCHPGTGKEMKFQVKPQEPVFQYVGL